MENKTLKRKVMVRIYIQYYKSMFLTYIEYILPIGSLFGGLALISARDVIRNMPTDDMGNTYNFFRIAIRDTDLGIKALCVAFAFSSVYLLGKGGMRLVQKIHFPRNFKFLSIRY